MITPIRAGTLALFALLSVSACTGTSLTRSGAEVDPVSLTSTYANGTGGVGSDVLDQLVAGTAGQPVSIAAPSVLPNTDDNDGDAVKRLQAGQADISVIRSDALDEAGATSVAALTAPFAVTNEDQAERISTDPIAAKLLAGLDRIGLVGLRLVPGGLRHPVGYKTPLLGLDSWKDQVINTRRGPGVERIITALGARSDHSINTRRSRLVADGTLRGIEVSFLQSRAADRPAVVTTNVTLYTKFDVVVLRKNTFDTLSSAQQHTLTASVDDAIAAIRVSRPLEDDAAVKWCNANDSSAVTASPGVIGQLQAALKPVTEQLRNDPTTAEALDRFAALHDGTKDPEGHDCAGPVTDETKMAPYRVKPRGDQTVLDGTWRFSATKQQILDAGVSEERAAANAGVWTVTIDHGMGDWSQPTGDPCVGNFSFDGKKVTLDYDLSPDNGCGGLSIGTYERKGDTVTFTWTADLDEELALDNVLYKTFVKVG